MRPLRRLVLLTLLPACGGSSRPANLGPTCGQVQPCGGDVVGDWTIATSCQSGLQFAFSFCPDPTINPTGLATTGTFSLRADLTYTVATTAAGSLEIDFPASCIASGSSCADLTPSVQSALATMLGPGLQSVTCSGTAACACTVFPVPSVTDGSGSYALSGSTVTTTPADGSAPMTFDFCAQGQTLHLMTLNPSMIGPGGQPAIVYDIVAQKP
jgi:hypothetical protein